MSELKRRTPEEVELWYLGKIASMTVEMMDFKEHAVEVLARVMLDANFQMGGNPDEGRLAKHYRAEARELLGIKE